MRLSRRERSFFFPDRRVLSIILCQCREILRSETRNYAARWRWPVFRRAGATPRIKDSTRFPTRRLMERSARRESRSQSAKVRDETDRSRYQCDCVGGDQAKRLSCPDYSERHSRGEHPNRGEPFHRSGIQASLSVFQIRAIGFPPAWLEFLVEGALRFPDEGLLAASIARSG